MLPTNNTNQCTRDTTTIEKVEFVQATQSKSFLSLSFATSLERRARARQHVARYWKAGYQLLPRLELFQKTTTALLMSQLLLFLSSSMAQLAYFISVRENNKNYRKEVLFPVLFWPREWPATTLRRLFSVFVLLLSPTKLSRSLLLSNSGS